MAEKLNQSRKSALLIGINEYRSPILINLCGTLSDVAATEIFLTEVAGISNITKITSPPALPNGPLPTLANIKRAFEDLADNAQPGDFIYIHYSGHGTRLPTVFADLKSANLESANVLWDECLVLVGDDGKLGRLRDVEITFLLKRIADKGATVTFVLDCCHSGGATRDDEGVRGSDAIPDDAFADLDRPLIQSREGLEDVWNPLPDGDDGSRGGGVEQHWMTASEGINFFAACQPKQKALEVPRGAQVRRGVFTDCLANVINQYKGADGLRQLSCDVVSNLVAHRLRNQEQKTVFGGRGDCHFFGAETLEQPAVVATCVEMLANGRLRLELTAGVAHGVRERDVFAIYPHDKQLNALTDYAAPLATCTVTAVEDFTCRAHIPAAVEGSQQVQVQVHAHYRAVSLRSILKDHVLQPKGVWVVLAADDGAGLVNREAVPIKAAVNVRNCIRRGSKLGEFGKLIKPTDAREAFFTVLVQEDGSFTISFTPGQAEATVRVPAGEHQGVLAYLNHLTIFYNLFNLARDNAAQQGQGLEVSWAGYLEESEDLPQPQNFSLDTPCPVKGLKHFPQGSIDVVTGQRLVMEVRNTSWDNVYVEILDLEPSWKVTRTYPRPNTSPYLIPPREGVYFFISTWLSDRVHDAVQPDTFDRFVVLTSLRNGHNFPSDILPLPGKIKQLARPVLEHDDGERAGGGATPPGWFVKHLDVRVVAKKEESVEAGEE